MKKLIIEQNIKKDRLSGIFLAVLVLLVVALSVTRVVIANRLVEASERMQVLDKSIAQLDAANQNLSEEIRGPQSISQVELKAEEMGFVKTSKLVFLTVSPNVALETSLPSTLR